MDKIFFLSDYVWEYGELIGGGTKNYKVRIPASPIFLEQIKYVPREKCAAPSEHVCIVWETWKGNNGRGGYRVEKHLYPEDRLRADQVNCQHIGGHGRVVETAYGVKK